MAKIFVTDVKDAEEVKPVEEGAQEVAVPVVVDPQVEEQPEQVSPVDEGVHVEVKAAEEEVSDAAPATSEEPAAADDFSPEVEAPVEEHEPPAETEDAPAPVDEAPVAIPDDASAEGAADVTPGEEEVPEAPVEVPVEAPVVVSAAGESEAPQLTFESVINDQVPAVREELPYERIPAECFTNTFDCVANPENRCCDFQ